jgi:hypothetical protein
MYYRSLTLEPIHGGPYHGAVAFYLALGDESNKSIGITDLVHEITKQTTDFALKGPGIIIEDSGYDQDQEVMQLVSVLNDRGYSTIAYCLPDRKPIWFSLCSWSRVMLVTGGKWLGYTVNEIAVTLDRNTMHPMISPNNAQAARLLMVARKTKASDILTFIQNSDYGWNVIYPSQGPFQLEFL